MMSLWNENNGGAGKVLVKMSLCEVGKPEVVCNVYKSAKKIKKLEKKRMVVHSL